MMILFVVLSFVMVFILIWQQIQHKKLVREIDYITSRLDTISVISENGFVLVPTDNDSIKKLTYMYVVADVSLDYFKRFPMNLPHLPTSAYSHPDIIVHIQAVHQLQVHLMHNLSQA